MYVFPRVSIFFIDAHLSSWGTCAQRGKPVQLNWPSPLAGLHHQQASKMTSLVLPRSHSPPSGELACWLRLSGRKVDLCHLRCVVHPLPCSVPLMLLLSIV